MINSWFEDKYSVNVKRVNGKTTVPNLKFVHEMKDKVSCPVDAK